MVIGIGGVSRAGKSKLAEEIAAYYSQFRIAVLCLDDFVNSKHPMPVINGHLDWEIPDAYDFDLLEEAILKAEKTHDIVVVEGILIFNHRLFSFYDKKIFLKISHVSFLQYKLLDMRWGKEPDWYIDYIWEAYNKLGIPKIDDSFLVLENDHGHDIDVVASYLDV